MKMFHFRAALFYAGNSLTLAISICGIFLKKGMNLFPDMFSTFPLLTYMSISHTHTAGALVDIHISASCRMSSVAHTHTHTLIHTHTLSQLLRYKPKIVNSPVRSVIVYCILRCSRYFALLLRSLCAFFFLFFGVALLLLPGLSTQPTGRRVCTWNILTM